MAIPIPVPIPWVQTIPMPYPGILYPPILIMPKPPGVYHAVPDNGLDWHNAPDGPDMNDPDSNPLGPDWRKDPGSDKDKTGKHRYYRNDKTGERVRWDADDKHWHRMNPDNTDKKNPYLDPDGKPVKRDAPEGHIKPNPRHPPNQFPEIPMA